MIYEGGKCQKGICRPESEDEDEDDPVTALEWDPLSADYLIMTNTFHPVRLIDTVSGTIITEFKLPSAAANVHTLAWISGAPGMFVTGGQILLAYFTWMLLFAYIKKFKFCIIF